MPPPPPPHDPPPNAAIARRLYELGTLVERSDDEGRRFRAAAYRRAAQAIAGLDRDVTTMDHEELVTVPGVGPGVAARIAELLRTGTIRRLDELRARDPAGSEALLRVPGLGPRSVARLRDALGVTDVAGLRAAVADGSLLSVRGIGPGTEARIAAALADPSLDPAGPQVPIAEAVGVAGRLSSALLGLRGVDSVTWAGALRRFRPLVDAVDLLVAAHDPAAAVRDFAALPMIRELSAPGSAPVLTADAATHDGPPARITVARPSVAGSALLVATGDDAYLAALADRAGRRGAALDATGLHRAAAAPVTDEHEIHAALGLPFVPPERREGADVVALAARDGLPVTAEVGDLRGDLHDHTDWSGDGRMTLETLVGQARARGWEYLAVTDHAEDLRINGLDRGAMLAQREQVRALRRRHDDLALLHGAELNIAADGGLDYDAEFLAGFDWTVASVHSAFSLDVAAQTRRVIAAIRSPAVRAIGHLSGRRIGRRPGIRLDLEPVLDACAETGTALEVNCHLDRLDASAEVLAEAAARGVLVVISTDAHRPRDLDQHRWGVAQARRGGVPRHLVANTWEAGRFLRWARADV